MEQVTPSSFKPNFKFENCKGLCYRRLDYLNEHNECELCEKCKRCHNRRRNYLNDFRICNTCCKQIKQMTLSGLKPNFKFEICKKCHQKKDYLSEFNERDLCIVLSGNEVIDNFIKYTNGKINLLLIVNLKM